MRTILAVHHPGIEQAVQGFPGIECLCLVAKEGDLMPACDFFQPDVLLVSTRLPEADFMTLTTTLCKLSKQHPSLRIILLAGESSLSPQLVTKAVKRLVQAGIYDLHLSDDLTLPMLEGYFFTPKSREDWKEDFKWTVPQWLSIPKLSFKLPKISSSRRETATSTVPSTSFDWKRWGGASLFFVLGGICFYFALKPIFMLNEDVSVSLEEWDQIQEHYQTQVKPETSEQLEEDSMLLGSKDEALIGVLQLTPDSTPLPVRIGISDEILNKGVGLDDITTLPHEPGNTVIYGHREEIFWGLKDLKLYDVITLQTLDGILSFQVVDLFVVEPDDERIYQSFNQPTLTLVTCYPFIYMGPTPERYVVVATLIES